MPSGEWDFPAYLEAEVESFASPPEAEAFLASLAREEAASPTLVDTLIVSDADGNRLAVPYRPPDAHRATPYRILALGRDLRAVVFSGAHRTTLLLTWPTGGKPPHPRRTRRLRLLVVPALDSEAADPGLMRRWRPDRFPRVYAPEMILERDVPGGTISWLFPGLSLAVPLAPYRPFSSYAQDLGRCTAGWFFHDVEQCYELALGRYGDEVLVLFGDHNEGEDTQWLPPSAFSTWFRIPLPHYRQAAAAIAHLLRAPDATELRVTTTIG